MYHMEHPYHVSSHPQGRRVDAREAEKEGGSRCRRHKQIVDPLALQRSGLRMQSQTG